MLAILTPESDTVEVHLLHSIPQAPPKCLFKLLLAKEKSIEVILSTLTDAFLTPVTYILQPVTKKS